MATYDSGAVECVGETGDLLLVAVAVSLQAVNALAQQRDLRLEVADGAVLVLECLLVTVTVDESFVQSVTKQ